MPHSYEEIRSAALDILSGREKVSHDTDQYENLRLGVGEVFARRELRVQPGHFGATYALDRDDSAIFLELFWDLFRQGIITLGLNDSNREFPFFRITQLGQKLTDRESNYLFHDISFYERAIRAELPSIDDVTMLYLKEAMQTFRAGCILSSTVMLGVATEHTFMLLLDAIGQNAAHHSTYASVFKERTLLQKVNKFKNILDQNLTGMSSDIKEDLDTHFAGILSIIRTFRNQAGHPTGKVMDREQIFVLLQLFIPYCRKLYQLTTFFEK